MPIPPNTHPPTHLRQHRVLGVGEGQHVLQHARGGSHAARGRRAAARRDGHLWEGRAGQGQRGPGPAAKWRRPGDTRALRCTAMLLASPQPAQRMRRACSPAPCCATHQALCGRPGRVVRQHPVLARQLQEAGHALHGGAPAHVLRHQLPRLAVLLDAWQGGKRGKGRQVGRWVGGRVMRAARGCTAGGPRGKRRLKALAAAGRRALAHTAHRRRVGSRPARRAGQPARHARNAPSSSSSVSWSVHPESSGAASAASSRTKSRPHSPAGHFPSAGGSGGRRGWREAWAVRRRHAMRRRHAAAAGPALSSPAQPRLRHRSGWHAVAVAATSWGAGRTLEALGAEVQVWALEAVVAQLAARRAAVGAAAVEVGLPGVQGAWVVGMGAAAPCARLASSAGCQRTGQVPAQRLLHTARRQAVPQALRPAAAPWLPAAAGGPRWRRRCCAGGPRQS